jgi:cyclohexanecarboxyl-CoA dehydrogenase
VIPDLGWESIGRGDVSLAEVRVPASYLIGEEGKGFYILMEYFDTSRVLLTLAILGSAQESLEEAIAYTGSRNAFGQPISSFQGVSFKLAEQATFLEAARMLCYQSLSLKDQKLPHTKEAAMAKWFGAKTAINVILEILLMHGHYGYSEELPFALRLRNAIGFDLAYGTGDIMKIIISRELTKGS